MILLQAAQALSDTEFISACTKLGGVTGKRPRTAFANKRSTVRPYGRLSSVQVLSYSQGLKSNAPRTIARLNGRDQLVARCIYYGNIV